VSSGQNSEILALGFGLSLGLCVEATKCSQMAQFEFLGEIEAELLFFWSDWCRVHFLGILYFKISCDLY
jgi:hypothetical protein